MASLSGLLKLFRSKSSCLPRCAPRPRRRSQAEDSDDESAYGEEASAPPPGPRPLTLTVPGPRGAVLVDAVMERRVDAAALVAHMGEWTNIAVLESSYSRAPVRVRRSAFSFAIRDADGIFEMGDAQAVRLSHGEWYVRQQVAPSVACFVAVVCLRNEGMAGIAVSNTAYLNLGVREGDVVVFPACRGVFFLPQVGGDVDYLLVNLVPTPDLLDAGYEVFRPSVNQDAQIRTASAAETRRQACRLVTSLVESRCSLEAVYQEICSMMIMMGEFGARYSEVGARMISDSVGSIARGMGHDGASLLAFTARRRPLSAALSKEHALLSSGLRELFSVFACLPDGAPHPDSLMARMEGDLRRLYDRFSDRWSDVLGLASRLDSTLARCDCVEAYVNLQVARSSAGQRRNELVKKLTLLASAGYRITGSGEGVLV